MATGTRYAGKVVVVTGGGRGIGAGIVRAFVDSGAQVVICDKDESGGRALEQELPGTVFILCDVTQEDDVKTLVSETIRRFGRLDCVVNNAGHHPPPQRPEETSAQGFRQLLELNLLGTYTLTKLALPHLRKSQGNVINISSLVGAIGQAQAVPYVATKGAVTAMTKALALDESPYGVRVNCISPGNIWTPLWEELAASTPDPRATILEGMLAQPLGRMGQPAEVGAAAVFLASEANFCTGIELLVTGGAELGKKYWNRAVSRRKVRLPFIHTCSLLQKPFSEASFLFLCIYVVSALLLFTMCFSLSQRDRDTRNVLHLAFPFLYLGLLMLASAPRQENAFLLPRKCFFENLHAR